MTDKRRTAKEVAKSCLPGCYDPTGQECSADYRCEIHYRVTKALEDYRNEGIEEAAKIMRGQGQFWQAKAIEALKRGGR